MGSNKQAQHGTLSPAVLQILIALAESDLHGYGIVSQFIFKLVNDTKRTGSDSVAFVDNGYTWYFVPFHLLINSNGLGLNTADRT